MTVIINDNGFNTDDWDAPFVDLAELAANDAGDIVAVDLASDAEPYDLKGRLDAIDMIRVDGRGFTIAAQLRRIGFQGRLRACGHVIADQYAMARRSGFDEVEISDELATRQPEDQWLRRANWQDHNYQSRLRG